MSILESHKEQLKRNTCEFDIWDERDSETLSTKTLKLNELREDSMRKAFESFFLPSISKRFPDWSVHRAFKLEEINLQFRLSDEFDLIESHEVMAMSLQKKQSHEASQVDDLSYSTPKTIT